MLSPESVNFIPKVQCDDVDDDDDDEIEEETAGCDVAVRNADALSVASVSQAPEEIDGVDRRIRMSNFSMLSRYKVHTRPRAISQKPNFD